MTTEITWTFPEVQSDASTGEVVSVFWVCTATDTGTDLTSITQGRVELTSPVVLSDMTYDSTAELVFGLVDKTAIETEVSDVLASKQAMVLVCEDPPFN